MEWSFKTVEKKLKSSIGLNSFLSGTGQGYLFLSFGRSRVVLFREDIGVSYYFLYPIIDVNDAANINEFMRIAIPYLNHYLEENREKNVLYKPQKKVNL